MIFLEKVGFLKNHNGTPQNGEPRPLMVFSNEYFYNSIAFQLADLWVVSVKYRKVY